MQVEIKKKKIFLADHAPGGTILSAWYILFISNKLSLYFSL